MMLTNINGPWKEGLVLDRHIKTSIYLGESQYGYPDFDNTRSELGDFIYDIKYDNNVIIQLQSPNKQEKQENIRKFYENFKDITENSINNFIKDKNIDYIVGAPSSKPRRLQPVHVICVFITKMTGIPYFRNALNKTTSILSKNMSREEKNTIDDAVVINDIDMMENELNNKNILIVDDLYETGSTLSACTNRLLGVKGINNIYVLAMTKTR